MRDWADVEPHPVNNSWPVHIGEVHKVHLSPHAAHDGKVSQRTAHHAAGLKHNKQMLVMPDTCSTWVPSVLYRTSTSELSQKNCLSQKNMICPRKLVLGVPYSQFSFGPHHSLQDQHSQTPLKELQFSKNVLSKKASLSQSS